MSSIKVLYEDNHIIAVVKPAGVLTQGDNSGDESLYDMVKDYIRIKKGKPVGNACPVGNSQPAGRFPARSAGVVSSGVFLGLVHRLDRPVSGIILFAKTSKGASRLSEQFRNHEIEKIYQAIVIGKPKEDRGTLINYLSKDEKTLKAKVSGVPDSAAKEAILHYEVISSNDKYSLLKIKLETGKFHQIRAQLSLAGFPILGDVKYGAPNPLPDKSIALSAIKISFKTATGDKIIELEIPFDLSTGRGLDLLP